MKNPLIEDKENNRSEKNTFNPSRKLNFKKVSVVTALLSVATLHAGNALACTIYWQPRINGLQVDRCVNSYRYPDDCSRGATQHAANRFCQEKGHRRAQSWQYKDTSKGRGVYRLLEESGRSYFRRTSGGKFFTGVLCQD